MLRNYAEIHLLRQQHSSAVSTPASLLSYKSAQHATRCTCVSIACRQAGSVIVVARATENRHHLLERERVLQPLAQDCEPARIKYKNTF